MWRQRKRYRRIRVLSVALLGLTLFVVSLFTLISSPRAIAAVGINQQLAFQGKLVLASGVNITDNTYNMEFKIYKGGSSGGGGTLEWTEDYLVGGSGGITTTSGTFNANLGSVNPFGGSVDWNSDTLWLSMQVGNTSSCTITTTFTSNCGGDGEMTPYIRLTAVPYAFNALELGGQTAASYGQLASGQTFTGANIFSPPPISPGLW